MPYTTRCPRRPVDAGTRRRGMDAPVPQGPPVQRPGQKKIEVTMKRTQPNARMLAAGSVNEEKFCRLRSARITLTTCKVIRLFWA